MKKYLTPALLVLAMLVLAGCEKKESEKPGVISQPVPADQKEEKSGSTLDNIKDAIGLGKKMECIYKVKGADGKVFESKMYIEGEKYKTESSMDGKKSYSIFDGKVIYIWLDGAKEGTKMNLECMKEIGEEFGSSAGETDDAGKEFEAKGSAEEALKNAVDVNCKPVNSIDFSVPSGIEFVDQCEMLKKQKEMMKQYQDKLPANVDEVEIPGLMQ